MTQDFKVTTFDSTYSQRLASGDTILGGSSGSNGSLGTGNFLTKNNGEADTIEPHGSLGAAATFDPADGNVHSGTLDADCTFTLNNPTGTGFCALELWLTQDGTGGWVITWPGSVTEVGTQDTTVSTTSRAIVETIDGGTSWITTWVGGSSGGGTVSAGSNSTRVSEISTAGASTTLFSPFDHAHDGIGTITASSSNTMQRGTVNLRAGTNVSFGLTDTDGDGEFDTLTVNSSATGGGTSSSSGGVATAKDTLVALYGTPATAYDLDTNSLVGLTALGTPSTENANTTIPGSYFARQNATASYSLVGRYQAIPAYPWTAIAVLLSASPQLDYNVAGLWIGVSSPGNMDYLHWGRALYQTALERVSPTAFSSTIVTARLNGTDTPMFFAIRANSTTSFDYMTSHDGRIWTLLQATRNPGITVANVGIAIKAENASSSMSAAFDLFYLYNSALTMAGA